MDKLEPQDKPEPEGTQLEDISELDKPEPQGTRLEDISQLEDTPGAKDISEPDKPEAKDISDTPELEDKLEAKDTPEPDKPEEKDTSEGTRLEDISEPKDRPELDKPQDTWEDIQGPASSIHRKPRRTADTDIGCFRSRIAIRRKRIPEPWPGRLRTSSRWRHRDRPGPSSPRLPSCSR